MSFWNNPENNPIKMLLIVVVLVGAGAFAYHAMNTGDDTGRVISTPAMSTSGSGPAEKSGCQASTNYKFDADGGGCTKTVVWADCSAATGHLDAKDCPVRSVSPTTNVGAAVQSNSIAN